MYDEYHRRCPKHPDLAHPCQICGELTRDVDPDSNPNTVIKGVNWQDQTNTPYTTPQPRPIRRFNPSVELMESLGAESGERPFKEKIPPPPRFGHARPLVDTTPGEFDLLEFDLNEFNV